MPDDRPRFDPRVRLPGLDADATPVVGIGLGLTGLIFGLRPRLAAWPLALTAAAALLFRDPDRTTPPVPGVLFAPADGVVVAAEEIYEHRFLHTDALRLTIEVSLLDVAIQRSPVSGRLTYLEEIAAGHPVGWRQQREGTSQGAALLIGIETDWAPVLVAIHASRLARRPYGRVSVGGPLRAGARLATTRLGARVDLLVPADLVTGYPAVGERVRGGVTRMASVLVR
jgi:phosphatidylserine decarboxylase